MAGKIFDLSLKKLMRVVWRIFFCRICGDFSTKSIWSSLSELEERFIKKVKENRELIKKVKENCSTIYPEIECLFSGHFVHLEIWDNNWVKIPGFPKYSIKQFVCCWIGSYIAKLQYFQLKKEKVILQDIIVNYNTFCFIWNYFIRKK